MFVVFKTLYIRTLILTYSFDSKFLIIILSHIGSTIGNLLTWFTYKNVFLYKVIHKGLDFDYDLKPFSSDFRRS